MPSTEDEQLRRVRDLLVKADVPTENRWVVLDRDEFVDVVPLDGAEHWMGDECWCGPEVWQEQGAYPVVTHVENS